MRGQGIPTIDALFKELNKLKPEVDKEADALLQTDLRYKHTKAKVLSHLFAVAKVQHHAAAFEQFDKHRDYSDIYVPPHDEHMDQDSRRQWLEHAFQPLLDLAHRRVQHAKAMYNNVDKHITNLDKLRAVLDMEIEEAQQELGAGMASSAQDAKAASTAHDAGGADAMVDASGQYALDAAGRPTSVPAHYVPFTFHFPGMDPIENVLVDPNEARYCICQQPSHGEMIGCDNDTCRYEWFHLPCVGITDMPKKKWYCPECREKLAKQKSAKRKR